MNGIRHTRGVRIVLAFCSLAALFVAGKLPAQAIHTEAGGFYGDGGVATNASDFFTAGFAIDASGNLYIVDRKNRRIRKVTVATGLITTVAGNGDDEMYPATYTGEGGLATNAGISPSAVAVDASGNLYIAAAILVATTFTNCIHKVTAGTGIITTVPGSCGLVIDGVAINASGTLYMVVGRDNRIYSLPAVGGTATVVAGSSFNDGFFGDGGPATSALFWGPRAIALDTSGNIYIADKGNQRIRKVTVATGIISTVAGNGSTGYGGDGGAATGTSLDEPSGVALDASNNLYIGDMGNSRIRRVAAATGVITTVAGNGSRGTSGDGSVATAANLLSPASVAVDSNGNLYIADNVEIFAQIGALNRVRKVTASNGTINTLIGTGAAIGSFSGDGGAAGINGLNGPRGVAVNAKGEFYLADQLNHRIRKVLPSRDISTVAGNGVGAFGGDGGVATSASLNNPSGVALSASGNILYVADQLNHRVRKLNTSTGIITTMAGNGVAGFSGDGGAAAQASLSNPAGVATDANGNLYIADSGNHRIRKISVATGIISTLAGNGIAAFSGDGGQATSASLSSPGGLAVDTVGNIYIADTYNHRIRGVTIATGTIATVAGNGSTSFGGDGGAATAASLAFPSGVAVDTSFTLYIADYAHNRIRRVNAVTGTISTVGGNGVYGYNGDYLPATSTSLRNPSGLAVDAKSALYLSDSGNHRLRSTTQSFAYGFGGAPPIGSSVGSASASTGLILEGNSASLVFDMPQIVGTSAPQRVLTVKNIQVSGTVNIFGIATAGEFAGTTTCGGSLPAGGICQIGITFTPAGIGERPGTLTINSDVPGATAATYLVTGFGVAAPAAPSIVNVAKGNAQATVYFLPPASDGESTITGYTATCGGSIFGDTQSPIVITGLSNGTTYTCTVLAINAAGLGTVSAGVSVTPAAVPAFPLAVVRAGTGSGSILSNPPGIGCPATCNANFGADSTVTLTASPAAGSTFATWAGCDSTNGLTCTVLSLGSARTVTATFSAVAATAPGAPVLTAAAPGNVQAVLIFTPPASNGGAAIGNYRATCNPGGIEATGLASPLIVPGLANNTTYACSLKAENSIGPGAVSGVLNVTPFALAPPTMIAVQSRKNHGSAGTFDLSVDTTRPISGAVTVEPRIIGPGHTAIFQFSDLIASISDVSAADSAPAAVAASLSAIDGNNVVVALPGVADNKRVTVSVTGLNGTTSNVSASIGFLVGDVNSTGSVNSSDISGVKARSGQTTNATNFKFDLNASGAINSSDISAVKARSGLVLP